MGSCFELTAGLNKPPLTRKKIHILIASERPNANEMYRRVARLGASESFGTVLATCVAEKAKNRNKNVPMNSPSMDTIWRRSLLESHLTSGGRVSPGRLGSDV